MQPEKKKVNIPSNPGTYAITMQLAKCAEITVGKLGTFKFEPGYYTYIGSAFGPGGLKARIGRHLKKDKKLKWHIDYLREYMEIVDIRFAETANNEECQWAAKLANDGGVCPIKGFGSSDCKCFSHLIYFDKIPQLLAQTEAQMKLRQFKGRVTWEGDLNNMRSTVDSSVYLTEPPQPLKGMLGQSKKPISVNDMNVLIKTGVTESNKA